MDERMNKLKIAGQKNFDVDVILFSQLVTVTKIYIIYLKQ